MIHKLQNAFTILEVMIVVSIIISLSAFSVMVYSRNTREQRFNYEVSRYGDLLNYARQNALINNTEGFQCPNYFGHKVIIHDSLDAFSLQICCFEACDCDPVRPVADPTCQVRNVKDYELHRSIHFKQQQSVRFREKAGGTGVIGSTTVTLSSDTLKKCVDITISQTGLIETGETYDC